MSASTMVPVVTTSAAPAPDMKRAATKVAKSGAYAHRRLPAAETRPPSASTGRRPIRSARLSGGQRDEEAREAVDPDGEADGRLEHAEGAGIERDDRHDAAEAELIHRDEHAHPNQDTIAAGAGHDRYPVSQREEIGNGIRFRAVRRHRSRRHPRLRARGRGARLRLLLGEPPRARRWARRPSPTPRARPRASRSASA